LPDHRLLPGSIAVVAALAVALYVWADMEIKLIFGFPASWAYFMTLSNQSRRIGSDHALPGRYLLFLEVVVEDLS
jgi:hypothetical protein